MARKKRDLKIIYLIAFLLVAAVSVTLYYFQNINQVSADISNLPDLSTGGFVKVEPKAQAVGDVGVISLNGNCMSVTANTDAVQAESIANGLEEKIGLRPNTHDTMKDAFSQLGVQVVMVKVVDIKENNFIGRLILRQGNTVVSLDSRPSDGIAIAVRTGAPIYFKEELMKKYGEKIC